MKIKHNPRYSYWFKKAISNSLIIPLILNPALNSHASILSADGRYETFEGSNITIDNILDKDNTDVEIKGNTLVNLIKNGQSSQTQPASPADFELTKNTHPGKKYTIVFNSNADSVYGGFLVNDSRWGDGFTKTETVPGLNKIVITASESYTKFRLRQDYVNVNISNVMLLEGDWSNREIPNYFEGMQSSFENQLVTPAMVNNGKEKTENLGKYKVEVKSTGKNLLNAKEQYDIGARERFIKAYELKSNTDYTFSLNYLSGENFAILLSNVYSDTLNHDVLYKEVVTDGGGIELCARLTNHITFNSQNYKYMYVTSWVYDGQGISVNQLQLEESSFITEYEPYEEHTVALYINEPLRGLPNGVTDRIIKKNGQWVIERNLKEIILDGTEEWQKSNTAVNVNTSLFIFHKAYDAVSASEVISDKFMYNSRQWSVDSENVKIYDNLDLDIRINKDRLSEDTVNGFKEWLKENNVKVVYQLAEPRYEVLDLGPTLNLYEDITHISNNSNIPTSMKVTVDRVLNRAKEAIKEAKINPTTQNISIARMWTNLAGETLKKDEFQNELDSITDIVDLEIEKKTVSANIDVYIKSMNSLSMSLNTSSVTFEDYSGVEDKEMQNAVEISVSSSLPYTLNAYLENPLQNSDGTSIIEASSLNIKESNQTSYQAFQNTSDKIVLNENSDANDSWNIHSIDLKLAKDTAHKPDVYRTTIKFEAVQK